LCLQSRVLSAQWERKDSIILQKGSIELAEKKGMEKGMEKVAIEMIRDCESNDKIRKYTGLTDDDIDWLRSGK